MLEYNLVIVEEQDMLMLLQTMEELLDLVLKKMVK